MEELAKENPRFGYRRIHALLRGYGFADNIKRVYRIWRQEGRQVPQRRRRWRKTGSAANSCFAVKATRPNEFWAYDFVSDQTTDGRTIKILALVDEFTREVLALRAGRSFKSADLIGVLKELRQTRGLPKGVRSDNGPEFVAKELQGFLKENNSDTLYIQPGSPWQNGYAESFNARLRDEMLDIELFGSLREARTMLSIFRKNYNERRPHSSLGNQTPQRFAESVEQTAA